MCELTQTFTDLAEGLLTASLVAASSQLGVQLVAEDKNQGLFATKTSNTYIWTRSAEGWREVAELTAPFCESARNGFQWLNEKGIAVLLSVDGKW